MWIRDVDLPEAVIDAHRNSELVLFVGAGASQGSPSDLPSFRTLTERIAAERQFPTDGRLDRLDELLGDIENSNVDVHRRVAHHIGVKSSKPNRLHKAITALAEAGGTVRIVTTNYDLHLSVSLNPALRAPNTYCGPALPVGDAFTGIVYLHGSLDRPPSELIVTDKDFGRAYLMDAWAARFLERMFSRYTVLFVGYSHNDVVMNYLARAIGRSGRRFALTDGSHAEHWRRLDIDTITYPNTSGDHVSLVEGLEKWATQSSMNLLEHEQQIARLVSTAPSLVPDEMSYLESVVTDETKLGFFVKHARKAEWLKWIATRPIFQPLVSSTAPATNLTRILGFWFAEHYVAEEKLSGDALRVLRDAGGQMSPTLRYAIEQRLHIVGEPRPDWLGPWLALLIQPAQADDWELLDYALTASQWPKDRAAALLLFDHLTDPYPVLERGWDLGETARLDVKVRGSDHWLEEAWKNLFKPNLADAAPALLATLDRHLRKAHLLLRLGGTATPGWDPTSYGRSAIEPHGQDRYGDTLGLLIDAARDCLEELLDQGSDQAKGYLEAWAASDVPLLRRLAIHGWIHRTDVDATVKLTWLRQTGWLYDREMRHEVFRLIETSVGDADPAVAEGLAADALPGPLDVDDDVRDNEILNALSWIVRHGPDLPGATTALQRLKTEYPEFREREHPDLTTWHESGTIGPQPPMSAEELHEKIQADTPAASVDLLTFESATSPFNGPTWYDTLGLLSTVVETWPEDGFLIHNQIGDEQPGLLGAVIGGWAKATLTEEQAEDVVARLFACDLTKVAYEVGRMLADVGAGESKRTDWPAMASVRPLANSLWEAIAEDEQNIDQRQALNTAINSTAGRVAEFWVLATAADWRTAGDNWDGLPEETREQLDAMLATGGPRTAMAQIILGSRLHFFYSADRAWCEEKVMPLLLWDDEERAKRVWDAFLAWGRWDKQMLTGGLLDGYLATAAHTAELGDDLTRQLCMHLAGVALDSEIDPLEQGWLTKFTTTARAEVRAQWIDQVGYLAGRLPAEAVKDQWHRWMKRYWGERINSVPVQLTKVEATALAGWVKHVPEDIAHAVELATTHEAGFQDHSDLLHDLTETDVRSAPVPYAQLIAHLLDGTRPPFYQCYKLRDIVPWFRTDLPEDVRDDLVAKIVENAITAGCLDATDW